GLPHPRLLRSWYRRHFLLHRIRRGWFHSTRLFPSAVATANGRRRHNSGSYADGQRRHSDRNQQWWQILLETNGYSRCQL
ncbi:hypothetical protein L6452_40827, partial [Arctium lappa]